MTFNEVADLYLQQPTKKFSTKQSSTRGVVGILTDYFGELPISKLESGPVVARFFVDLRQRENRINKGKKLSNGYINTIMRTLKSVLIYARDDLELINRAPKTTALPANSRDIFLTPEQVRELMRWLDELRADMVEFSVNTGLRNSNVRLLKWVDLEDNFTALRVDAKNAKNYQHTLLPLNSDAQRVIRRRRAHKLYLEETYPHLKNKIEYVFVQEDKRHKRSLGRPFSANSIVTNHIWHTAVERAGLPSGVVFHSMRHTFASWHIQNGTSETVLQALGTWKSESSMKRYTHLAMEHKAKGAANINGLLRRK